MRHRSWDYPARASADNPHIADLGLDELQPYDQKFLVSEMGGGGGKIIDLDTSSYICNPTSAAQYNVSYSYNQKLWSTPANFACQLHTLDFAVVNIANSFLFYTFDCLDMKMSAFM